MFGKKGRLEKKLERGEARRAYATVVEWKWLAENRTRDVGTNTGLMRLHLRVEPEAEPPFEVSMNTHITDPALVPNETGKLPVVFDPEDRDEVMLDLETAKRDWGERAGARMEAKRLADAGGDASKLMTQAELQARLQALQGRKDRGELGDWEFRTQRAEIFKEYGF